MLADLTGPIAGYDKPVVAGLQTYLDALDAKGGVHGHKVTAVVLDTKGYDVPTTRTDFSTLVSQSVVAIEGPLLSTAYQAVEPLATQAKVALLSAGAPPEAVQKAQPYFYLTGIPLQYEANIAVKEVSHLAGSGAKPRIAALRTSSVSTQSWDSTLAADVQSSFGTPLVSNVTLDDTSIDPSTQVAQIVAAKPDFVMLRILASQVPLAVKDLRQEGFTGEIISDYGGADTSVLKAVDDPKYLAIRQFQDTTGSSEPAVQTMVAQAQTAGLSGSATSSFFTYGYLTGSIIAQVLESCGSTCSSSEFASTLSGLSAIKGVAGLSGPLGYAPGTHQMVNYGRLYRWDGATGSVIAVSGWIDGAS